MSSDLGTVLRLRRYPVKSMGGEPLESAELDHRGLIGDRSWAVVDDEGKLASGKNTRRFRRYDAVFDFSARTLADGIVQVSDGSDEWLAGDAALDRHLTDVFGRSVAVKQEGDTPHHDDGAVSFIGSATLEWCRKRWGIDADPRRLRANAVVETEEPFAEEEWIGRELVVGSARLAVRERITRCRMIDLAQDGVPTRARWLQLLGQERDLQIAMYAEVAQPGRLSVGDAVLDASVVAA